MIVIIFLSTVAALSVMAWVTVFSQKQLWYRWCAVLVSISLMVGVPLSMYELLSRPKEVSKEMFQNPEEVELLSYYADQGVALYLWILMPGIEEPRYYVIPWEDGGKELERGIGQAQESAGEQPILIPHLFEPSLETDKTPYPRPQEAPPQKEAPENVRQFGS